MVLKTSTVAGNRQAAIAHWQVSVSQGLVGVSQCVRLLTDFVTLIASQLS